MIVRVRNQNQNRWSAPGPSGDWQRPDNLSSPYRAVWRVNGAGDRRRGQQPVARVTPERYVARKAATDADADPEPRAIVSGISVPAVLAVTSIATVTVAAVAPAIVNGG